MAYEALVTITIRDTETGEEVADASTSTAVIDTPDAMADALFDALLVVRAEAIETVWSF